eukprot:TRINITY_DN8512_c0_g1_i3.p1 TRINITY_DN8512_c0_g1~~TRINITY_DN8512_c0_g1_i3.p1  ORF type:complete len:138 (+),score=29.91 TRINITY_DN8512_c0_g1_i3:627-1040(+)
MLLCLDCASAHVKSHFDLQVRQAKHTEGDYCLSYRSTPKSVTHKIIKGTAGAWRLTYAKEYATIQLLVQASIDSDQVDRAAIAETDGDVCPHCAMVVSPDESQLFCENCGCRLRTKPDDAEAYYRIGREYLQDGTAA